MYAGGPVAERDADADREDQRHDAQFERGRKAAEELLHHGPVRLDRCSEVALEQAADPDEVLLEERPVEAVQLVDSGDGIRGRLLTEKGDGGSAGKSPDPGEQQDTEAEQGGDEEQQSPADGTQQRDLR
jgi:hypothetical protein